MPLENESQSLTSTQEDRQFVMDSIQGHCEKYYEEFLKGDVISKPSP
jgi:hypothetical protein